MIFEFEFDDYGVKAGLRRDGWTMKKIGKKNAMTSDRRVWKRGTSSADPT